MLYTLNMRKNEKSLSHPMKRFIFFFFFSFFNKKITFYLLVNIWDLINTSTGTRISPLVKIWGAFSLGAVAYLPHPLS